MKKMYFKNTTLINMMAMWSCPLPLASLEVTLYIIYKMLSVLNSSADAYKLQCKKKKNHEMNILASDSLFP